MKGKEWNDYFKRLEPGYRKQLLDAFLLIDQDPMIQKAFGRDFLALANFIEYPLKDEKEN